tara:strand:- start:8487 stop:9272 length:786 start_codon:yes stop_codon:yes gene_type:complete
MNTFETSYLKTANDIITQGDMRYGRNGGTLSLPTQTLTFDLRDGLPMLTTRKSFYKGVFGEYAALIRGPKHVDDFTRWGCNFWGKWAKADGSIDLDYGNAWTDFHGVNQMETVLNLLRTDYTDRRMIITGWDPSRLAEVDLPCCHYSYQFWSDGEYLDLLWTQRSGDWMIGVPADALLASAMVCQFASLAGLKPRKVTMVVGDAHVYAEHIETARVQIAREPLELPSFTFAKQNDLTGFTPADFVVAGYKYHASLAYELKE